MSDEHPLLNQNTDLKFRALKKKKSRKSRKKPINQKFKKMENVT